jgi:iron only hydrogenase large subunit-like protein
MGVTDFEFNPIVCDGIDKCKTALLKASKGVLPNNFIEGMICPSGCIGGAACLSHGPADKSAIDKYGETAEIKKVMDAVAKVEK